MSLLVTVSDQPDLPFGTTYQCQACGTRVRPGQPHSATLPHPHQTYDALTVVEVADIIGREAGEESSEEGVQG